jgi:hypothetical protein
LLDEVAEEKFTTFGRLAGDPDFRAYCGFEIKGDVFTATDTSENVVLRLSLVLDDFRGDRSLTVTQLKSKADRARYINELKERVAGADESDADPEEDDNGEDDEPTVGAPNAEGAGGEDDTLPDGTGDSAGPEPEPEPSPPPMKLFIGASLSHCSLRLRNILNEVQKIPLNRYPNSAAALIRMVIEMSVIEAHEVCGWPDPPEKDKNLRHYVANALRQLDPTKKASRYLGLRQQLNKKDSIVNTVTLNAFLHNPAYSPSAPDMRAISDTYSILLVDINGAIRDAKDSAP